jgi:hypothetical protein
MLLRLFGSLIVSPTPSPTFRRLLAQTPPKAGETRAKGGRFATMTPCALRLQEGGLLKGQ